MTRKAEEEPEESMYWVVSICPSKMTLDRCAFRSVAWKADLCGLILWLPEFCHWEALLGEWRVGGQSADCSLGFLLLDCGLFLATSLYQRQQFLLCTHSGNFLLSFQA